MMVLNNGGRFLSADGTKFSYSSPEALEAVEWQYNLFKQGLMPSLDQFPGGKWKELMPDGKVAFEFAVAARVPLYRQQGTQFGTTYYPIGPSNKEKKSVTHGEAYGVSIIKNKDAKRQQAALLAALWGTRPDMGVVLATKAGVPPSYKTTIEDPAFQAKFKNDPDTWVFMDLIAGYIPMPNFPGFADVRAMADGKVNEIWTGKSSIRDALAEITRLGQQRLDEMLK
jgi:ABC-type glycerol-3-phosphate transport system substrate-binding protein